MMLFCLYAILLVGMGLLEARRGGTVESFFVNNRTSGTRQVGISIIASCVGGSATIGMAGLAWEVGTPAFWWLGSGAAGLLLLTIFLARKVRETGAYTMPEMISTYLGDAARPLVSIIIVTAWMAILAAQFTAMGKLTVSLTGLAPEYSLLIGSALIILYSVLGGQASVIRSDVPQCALLFGGLVAILGFLIWQNPTPLMSAPLELVNTSFPVSRLSYYLLVLGGSYVVCPMLFGRFLSAKDAHTAYRGGILAIFGLLVVAMVIVGIGISCRGMIDPTTSGIAPDDVLPQLLSQLPSWLGLVLLLALLSAVLSSADSCLITASTVLCNDLFRRREVTACRAATLLLGAGGLALAFQGKGILALLLMANDIYVCGVVAPVFIGMVLHGKAEIPSFWAASSVVLGGSFGLTSALTGETMFSFIGMAVSAGICLLGAYGDVGIKCLYREKLHLLSRNNKDSFK